MMKLQMRVRLSVMMFLQYFIWAAWYVTLGTWLASSLHLTGQQIGWAAGTTAIGAIVAPFFVGLIADKLFATQRVLAVLHLVGAVLLYLASRQSTFAPIYVLLLVYCLCFMPTMALTNSLSFRQMRDPKEEFGPIRVLGTGGWIVAGLLVGFLKLESTAIPMQLASISSLLMGLYCLTLPDTPPLGKDGNSGLAGIFPREALHLLADRPMAIFAIASLLICIPLQFYYAFTNLFLNESGVQNAAGKMTGGQMSELFFMLLIPWFFRRLGIKYMLVAGMLAWSVRYILFAYGGTGKHMWMLWGGILLHGICYDFFFVTGQIYIDRKAPDSLRAAAQGLITLITYGLGMFVGSWLSGLVVDRYAYIGASGAAGHEWNTIWLFASGFSGVVLLGFLFTFSDKRAESVPRPDAEESIPLQVPLA
jgi:nucleoside transporter